MQIGIYLSSVLGGACLYFAFMAMVVNGWWWLAPVAMIVASPVTMAVLRVMYEQPFKLTRDFINPFVMSWAFVVGDFLLLPLVLLLAVRGWGGYHAHLAGSVTFLIVSLVLGYIAAAGFTLVDGQRYVEAGVPTARFSPTKVWHDWAVVPGVVAALVWTLLPQIKEDSPIETFLAMFILLGFMVLIIVDEDHPVDPRRQHPAWNVDSFEPMP